MKLGKLQKYWIEQLRKHPERQLAGVLGQGTPKEYRACCLGELHLCAYRLKKKKLPFDGDSIQDGHEGILEESYKDYGLRSETGTALKPFKVNGYEFSKLSAANDNGVTWTQIADIIEANPENFFTKSV